MNKGILKIMRAARTNSIALDSFEFSISNLDEWQPVAKISGPGLSFVSDRNDEARAHTR